ncbi:hypothetical protein MKZ38_001461 [Zalerion maritima]|uniref:Ornithine cyclodeaminase n=1 Tax=Zalerion maritima TaxID=339359 RepID=A0AAD5RXJ3_9PEZI|nr:hypothetical protein MKZ38_001461 [Zalerion maritima]
MTIIVLSDDQIRSMLENLTLSEAEGFRTTMEAALHEYSTGKQDLVDDEGSPERGSSAPTAMPTHQPPRTSSISPATGATNLFMPSTNSRGVGVKVVTLMAPEAPGSSPDPVPSSTTPSSSPASTASTRPTGAITLFSPAGAPLGLLHARTLTAFRTALASLTLIVRRSSVKHFVCFGSGEQAYWHLRLSLLFRGFGIKDVTLVNPRSGPPSASADSLVSRLLAVPFSAKEKEGWADTKFGLLGRGEDGYGARLAESLRRSCVVVAATPSTSPLFAPEILTSHSGRRKGRLVVAIGSYRPHMIELPTELLLQATKRGTRRHFHKHAREGGVVVVDSIDGAMEEAGEIHAAGLDPGRMVELGELLMLGGRCCGPAASGPRAAAAAAGSSSSSSSSGRNSSDLEEGDAGRTPCSDCVVGDAAAGGAGGGEEPTTAAATTTASPSGKKRGPGGKFSFLVKNLAKGSGGGSGGSSSSGSSHPSKSESTTTTTNQDGSTTTAEGEGGDDEMTKWLREGNVIYKCVGIGVMDLSVGMHIIELAKERGIGTHVEWF